MSCVCMKYVNKMYETTARGERILCEGRFIKDYIANSIETTKNILKEA